MLKTEAPYSSNKAQLTIRDFENNKYYEVNNLNPLPVKDAIESSVATGGTNTTIVDDTKDYETNLFIGKLVKINIGDVDYLRTIVSNSGNTLVIAPLPEGVMAANGCEYSIKEGVRNVIFGLSTDTKPTTGIPKGKVFYAMDTKTYSMWTGTAWI